VDPAGTTSFTYNQLGQVLTKTQLTGAVALTVAYTYDAFARLSSIKYPSGKLITYSYDTSGRVSALLTGAGGIVYFPFGPAKGWTEPNGATYGRTFDKDGRISFIALGGTVNVQTLTYDNASRITGLTETGLNAKAYGYDNDDRLTSFVNDATTTSSYTYDADSNRSSTITAAGTTTYHYPTTSNRVVSLSGLTTETETYDVSGNQIFGGKSFYNYDARGRLVAATTGGILTRYYVNAFGQRIEKAGPHVPNGGANEYVYDEQGHLIGEYNSGGGIVNETVWLGDIPVAVLSGAGGATVYSVGADWLNAPHVIQNAGKQNVWTWDHYAFGDNVPNQNPTGLGAFVYNPRFPGQYKDVETGLNYNINRDYNPTLGRYVESDPIGLKADINTYGYVRANPISLTDAKGTQPNNYGRRQSFDKSQWDFVGMGDDFRFYAGNIIGVEASSLAFPPTNQFWFTVLAWPTTANGTPEPVMTAPPPWYDPNSGPTSPVWYASGLTGSAISGNQFVIHTSVPNPKNLWTLKIPDQQDAHANAISELLQAYTPKDPKVCP
jgi:RHS repeat-associated protein